MSIEHVLTIHGEKKLSVFSMAKFYIRRKKETKLFDCSIWLFGNNKYGNIHFLLFLLDATAKKTVHQFNVIWLK